MGVLAVKKKVIVLTGMLFASFVFVLLTGLLGGKQIRTYDELESAFPVFIGFPVGFIELKWPKIDPPLPYVYGIDCCGIEVHQGPFFLSVLIVFCFFILVYWISIFVFSKVKE